MSDYRHASVHDITPASDMINYTQITRTLTTGFEQFVLELKDLLLDWDENEGC